VDLTLIDTDRRESILMHSKERICRVCGHAYPGLLWEDYLTPAHGICDTCGNQSGLTDSNTADILYFREQWLISSAGKHIDSNEHNRRSENFLENLNLKHLNEILLEAVYTLGIDIEDLLLTSNSVIFYDKILDLILRKSANLKDYSTFFSVINLFPIFNAEKKHISRNTLNFIERFYIKYKNRNFQRKLRIDYRRHDLYGRIFFVYINCIFNKNDIYIDKSMRNSAGFVDASKVMDVFVGNIEIWQNDPLCEMIVSFLLDTSSYGDTPDIDLTPNQRVILQSYTFPSIGPEPGM
jgi:hypothetical protein